MITRSVLSLCVALLLCRVATAEQPLEAREVFARGVGISPGDAAQNAAENALRQVVGAFIDSQQAVEKRAQINEGIRSETKSISSKTAQYSQGSIKSFELVDVKPQNGLFEAEAKVAVRVEDFKAYITKVAEAEAAVDMGEIAAMATDLKQRQNINQLLLESIQKILSGQVVKLEMGKPVRLSSYIEEIKTSGTSAEQQPLPALHLGLM